MPLQVCVSCGAHMAALSRNMQGRQPGSASPSRSQHVGNEAGLACPVALPTTEGLELLNYASVMLSSLWSFLSMSPGMS